MPRRSFDDPARLGAKIRAARESLKLNQREFSNRIGASQSNVSKWEQGDARPESGVLMKIAELLKSEADSLYFMMAAGVPTSYFMGDPKWNGEVLPSEFVSSYSPDPPAPTYQVPLLSDPAAAGTTRAVDPMQIEAYLPYLKSWAPPGSAMVAIRAKGESMAPLILDNYIVFVDTAQHDHTRLAGRMVLARDSDGCTFKWLRQSGSTYMLVAQNTSPRFPITILDPDKDWAIVGAVINWVGAPPPTKRK